MNTLINLSIEKTTSLLALNRLEGKAYAIMDFEFGQANHITNFSVVIYSRNGREIKRFNEWALDTQQGETVQKTTFTKSGKWITPNNENYFNTIMRFNNFVLENEIGTKIPLLGWGVKGMDLPGYSQGMENYVYTKIAKKESDLITVPIHDLQDMMFKELNGSQFSLQAVCTFFNVEYPGDHVGAEDIEATNKIMWRLKDMLKATGREQKYNLYQF